MCISLQLEENIFYYVKYYILHNLHCINVNNLNLECHCY